MIGVLGVPEGVRYRGLENLLESPAVRRWINNYCESAGSFETNLYNLKTFLGYWGGSPDDFVDFARADLDRAFNYLRDFHTWLLTVRKFSSKYALNIHTAVRTFLRFNGVVLAPIPRVLKRASAEYELHHVLSNEEIREMINRATCVRDKAIVVFLPQSGQRVGILTALKWGVLREQIQQGLHPVVINVPAVFRDQRGRNVNKIRFEYRFAIGLEAIYWVKMMMDERVHDGEPIDDDSWLFRSYSAGMTGVKPLKIPKNVRGPALSRKSIQQLVKECARPKKASEKRYLIHPHTFRIFFNMKLQEAGCDRIFIKGLMGQMPPYRGAYDQYTPNYIRGEWLRRGLDKMLAVSMVSQAEEYYRWLEMAKTLKIDIEEAIRLFEAGGNLNGAIELIRKRIEEQLSLLRTGGGRIPSTKVRQRIVSEDELNSFLEAGWKATLTLPSGKIVVEHP